MRVWEFGVVRWGLGGFEDFGEIGGGEDFVEGGEAGGLEEGNLVGEIAGHGEDGDDLI